MVASRSHLLADVYRSLHCLGCFVCESKFLQVEFVGELDHH